ncbi:MAG: OmpA family protein [Granulosicoccus sp.]
MNNTHRSPVLAVGILVIGLSACSSAPKEVELLEQVRYDYAEVAQNVTVVKHAPEVLDEARDALQTADSRWKKKDDQWRVEHYAYLAKQRIKTAKLISERLETDREIEGMVSERRNLTLKLRDAELKKARQEAMDLKRQMAALQAEQTERGMVLTLGDVLFDVDKATLAPGAARNIAKIATFMRNYPERRAVIEGHTDSVGEADYNMDLSRDRAFAVRDALVDAGIEASRMSTQGFGETLPVATNDTHAGRQGNRRVEIIFPDANSQVTEFDDY